MIFEFNYLFKSEANTKITFRWGEVEVGWGEVGWGGVGWGEVGRGGVGWGGILVLAP
jgi:hypothetical protein